MKEHQTPRKDLSNRRSKDSPSSKSISDHSKKTHKIAKKSLNSEFSSVSEDLLTESAPESFNLSPVSEVFSDNHNGESPENLECLFPAENYSLSAIEEAMTQSDSTSSSKIITVNDESIDLLLDWRKTLGSNGSAEAEAAVMGNLLQQARVQVLSSSDIHPRSKKLLDSLVEVSVKEFYTLPVKEDLTDVLISERIRVLVLCFMVWLVISMSLIVFGGDSATRSSLSIYPSPT